MEWSESKIATLIDLYREQQCLWDSKCLAFKLKAQKMDAWTTIADKLDCDPGEIQRKMKVILSQYRRERQKMEKRMKSGASADEASMSHWIHFKGMQFLKERDKLRNMKDSFMLEEFSEDEHDDTAKDTVMSTDNVEEGVDGEEKGDVHYTLYYHDSSSNDVDKPTGAEKTGTGQIHVTESSRKSLIPAKNTSRKRPRKETSGADDGCSAAQCVADRYRANKHECSVFGKFVGCKLRKYDDRTRAIAQQRICNVLFAIDLEAGNSR
ncbi:uncharacterized protein LOC143213083 [Lasioglossum baleicum]|uniref:uncharacterized protein LOC143213083 n=1 Tax=Lasioglossum baleicum TaxID=434251 RepID=UPI003FCD9C37